MCPGFSKRKQAVMSVLKVQVIAILMMVLLESKRSIWKMKPRFDYKDEDRLFIFNNFQEVKCISRETFYVPS